MDGDNLYFCGGLYGEGEARNFYLVRPTGGLPYVRKGILDAVALYRLCEHHSTLYRVEGSTAVRVYRAYGEDYPERHELTAPQIAEIMESVSRGQ